MDYIVRSVSKHDHQQTLQLEADNRAFERVELERLDWDTKLLGVECGRLSKWETLRVGDEVPAGLYKALVAELPSLGLEYVTARIPSREWSRVHLLERAGFRVVDGIIEFRSNLAAPAPRPAPPDGYVVRQTTVADADKVAALAVSTFKFSRFHNDPLVTRAQADRVHFVWAKNSVLGTAAEAVWIVEHEGRVAGFITCVLKRSVGQISLVGVDPADAGRGLGSLLIAEACHWFAGKGCSDLRVQTQTDNLAAIRLYAKLGMAANASFITLRWAAKDGA